MLKKLSDFLSWAENLFIVNKLYFGHGTVTAWDEAVFVASYVLDINLYQEDLKDIILNKQQLAKLKKIVFERIKTKKPLAYIINTAWFAGRKYYVNSSVIVPRSPIAELINNRLQPYLNLRSKNIKILDLCTGSGCIAIASYHALQHVHNMQIDAVDICSRALNIANKNLKLHNINKINLIKSDLFNNIPSTRKYNLIITNPPYVDQTTFANLPQEFYAEPKKALLAGKTGFELIHKILQQAGRFLATNGILIVEVGVNWRKFTKLYPHIKFNWIKFNNGGEGIFWLNKQQLH